MVSEVSVASADREIPSSIPLVASAIPVSVGLTPVTFSNLIFVKLTHGNYLFLRAQFVSLLYTHALMGYIDDSKPYPHATITTPTTDGSVQPDANPLTFHGNSRIKRYSLPYSPLPLLM